MANVKVTCHTADCQNENYTIDTGIPAPGPDAWYCGACSEQITDIA